jgi:hypothetical protein
MTAGEVWSAPQAKARTPATSINDAMILEVISVTLL